MGSVDNYTDDDVVNTTPRTQSLIHFVLGNFFFAMFSISLTLSIIFFAATWFTVLRDRWFIKGQANPDPNAVSLHIHIY